MGMPKSVGVSVCAAAALALVTNSAEAASTTVNPPQYGEASHADIFSQVYGGTFVADGLNFTNGTITAKRVDDNKDKHFTTVSGFTASVKAVFAQLTQQFGVIKGESGGSFEQLLSVTNKGYNATGDVGLTNIDGLFRFARSGNGGVLASSNPLDNVDGYDHLVTYQITGLDRMPVLVLFFEDLRFGQSDWDYNDLVVEVTGAQVVPTPAAFGAGLTMLATGLLRRRRKA